MNNPSEEELENLVDQGQLTEEKALRLLQTPGPPVKVPFIRNINEAHKGYLAKTISEERFYQSLLKFVEKTVKRHSHDRGTFSNIEDAISNSLLEIWQRLPRFDARRSTFSTFVTIVVLSRIRMLLREHKRSRGGQQHIQLEEESLGASGDLGAERRLLFEEWMRHLGPLDRSIVQLMRDGLTQEEIAQALDIDQATISRHLDYLQQQDKRPF